MGFGPYLPESMSHLPRGISQGRASSICSYTGGLEGRGLSLKWFPRLAFLTNCSLTLLGSLAKRLGRSLEHSIYCQRFCSGALLRELVEFLEKEKRKVKSARNEKFQTTHLVIWEESLTGVLSPGGSCPCRSRMLGNISNIYLIEMGMHIILSTFLLRESLLGLKGLHCWQNHFFSFHAMTESVSYLGISRVRTGELHQPRSWTSFIFPTATSSIHEHASWRILEV